MKQAQAKQLDAAIAQIEKLERDLITTDQAEADLMGRLAAARRELLDAWNAHRPAARAVR